MRAAFVTLALTASCVSAQPDCVPAGQQCGSGAGFSCCVAGTFCQAWDSNYYQCIDIPSGCSNMETDVDYYGDDLASFFGLKLPSDCCNKCQENPECEFFTFLNTWGPACYLKKGSGAKQPLKGAVSGRKIRGSSAPSMSPVPTPSTPAVCVDNGAACGGATSCCDTQAAYCHPWDATNYLCIDKPSTCAAGLETDIDYYGADLATVNNVDLADCCDRCTADANCKVFTFVPASRACYLKTSDAGRVAFKGAVSGKRGSGSGSGTTPTPTTPPPTTPSPVPAPLPTPTPSGNWDASRCGTQKRNLYYHGNDIAGSERAFATVEQCCDYCRATSGCKAFTYFRRGSQQRCLLKTGIKGAEKTSYAEDPTVFCMSGVFE